jgi:CheY-like chemotaxis protein
MMDRILVAEDDAALRLLYTIWLESAGFDVTPVADGRAALEALERRPLPDAALLDVEMPFVDGLSVCRYLHALDPSVRIIVVTGMEDARRAALTAGAADVIRKPCDRGQIVAAVRLREAAQLRLTA